MENRLVLSPRTLFFGEEDGCSSGRKIQNFRGKEGRREKRGNFFDLRKYENENLEM